MSIRRILPSKSADYREAVLKVVVAATIIIGSGAPEVWGGQATDASLAKLPVPVGAPTWLPPNWRTLMSAPLPGVVGPTPNLPAILPATTEDYDPSGWVGTYQPNGSTTTAGNAFFQSLGTNGRACVTCHVPANGLGISASAVQAQFRTYGVNNPLFAPVDGATCPSNVPLANTGLTPLNTRLTSYTASNVSPYVLLLNKGLFRIPLPVPASADYTVSITRDPYGCNTSTAFDQVKDPTTGAVSQILSLYRRPLMAANLKFKTTTAANTGLFPSAGLPVDPFTHVPESGNIMWDGREATLQSQATDATLGHAQALSAPTAAQVAQMVAFENGIYAAQVYDNVALSLSTGAVAPGVANGGPVIIAATAPATALPGSGPDAFALYAQPNGGPSNAITLQRASIIRGQALFNTKTFSASNVAGLNDVPAVGNPVNTTCSGCHRQINAGTEALPDAAMDIGIGGTSQAFGGPAPTTDLPVFTFICKAGASTSFHNTTVVTNDPGVGLISGKCADIGKFTIPGLRALAARAPYFHDGSAAALSDVVNFYNTRFRIGLSAQDQLDLVNFLKTL